MLRRNLFMIRAFTTILVLCDSALVDAIIFVSYPQARDCFSIQVDPGQDLHISYEANADTGTGVAEVVFTAAKRGDEEHPLYQSKEPSYTEQFSEKDGGTYILCLQSQSSDNMTISLDIKVDKHLDLQIATKSHAAESEALTNVLSERIEQILIQQEFAMTRESIHRSIAESTNERVLWWTILEAMCLLGLTAFQIKYLRSFFETKQCV